uniref:phosphogluconate dehydrogenase (NADP(+)-dependent, decarboxylating) n=1 Tax=Phaeomonas parva TaxID=124430 RepID=A0A6U4GAQ4_9STRA|mmetsp:Transcript_28368/g.90760  ORF Transcript_28368/g.90760 Transcript_28368/m.90760 type:complete len:327 (+) Transcript_28368:900-1880(+)
MQVDGEACTFYIGPVGSGNYVKMVHNGIEYGDMQLIAEAYDVLRIAGGLSNEELAETFAAWNQSEELDSFLIEITSKIFTKRDDLEDEGFLVDKILDKTGMKGTGRWTIQEAAEQSVAASTMAAALDMRYMSGRKDERITAATILQGPSEIPSVARDQIVADVKEALYCAKICSYAQGMALIRAASDKMDWGVDLSECARIWKGGCIIRARFLDKIRAAYAADPRLPNLMIDPAFAQTLNSRQSSWRRIVSLCVASGIACPALAASLNYYDTYRRPRLPANLTQAQRDFFGGHSYERTDRPGNFHCAWTDAHKDIGSIEERNAGNL